MFKSKTYGNVLVLDGIVQVTERDEFAYQEMIAHTPLFAVKNAPKKVLIIGGGDGGVLREVAKHASVETIHMCEIDQQVCEVSKKFYTASLASGFSDPRCTLFYEDAAAYLLREGKGKEYDVIICDSSDPVGPNASLFTPEFYHSMYEALSPDGVICTQGECQWLHVDFIKEVMDRINIVFPSVAYCYTTIPSYPSGQIGLFVSSKDGSYDVSVPSRTVPVEMEAKLQYYTSAMHSAAFVLPAFAARKVLTRFVIKK
jgi:spermidine synthase